MKPNYRFVSQIIDQTTGETISTSNVPVYSNDDDTVAQAFVQMRRFRTVARKLHEEAFYPDGVTDEVTEF